MVMRLLPVFLTVFCFSSLSCKKKTLFEALPSSQTGIHFINKVEENEKYNVLDYMNIYTGAGVAAGDVNNDGLPDLYFSGNETSGRLYLNKGNFKFEDVTEKAGLLTNRWGTGVSMVDINADGWLDIYVCIAGSPKFGSTANLLFINQKNGTFKEEAAKWGVADTRLTMNASFFDYDRDGDLDLFLITNPADSRVDNVNTISEFNFRKDAPAVGADILYRNNGNETFTDVSAEAGINKDGYSLGAAISDINGDGWPDIYVSNDFLTSDILYINNGNGTFTDKIHDCLKHTSFASMGNDVADINNDGLPDIYTLDMLPEDNYRKKMIIPAAGYDKFQLLLQSGYETQYTRNALQLNNGNGTFSDIAFLSGVAATDWSWAPLFADYDNDGDKDLLVTNGFYRDLGDQDYIHYQAKLQNPMGREDARRADKLKAINELQKSPLLSYLFENNGNLTFTKRSEDWGFTEPGFSNGACYADLDSDGNEEIIINQFNAEAKIFKNNGTALHGNHFLTVQLTGPKPNLQAIGAKVFVYTKGGMQMEEMNPYRGFESSMEPVLHFGLGKSITVDSIRIIWPDGKAQIERQVKANQTIHITYKPTVVPQQKTIEDEKKTPPLFTSITGVNGLNFTHTENEFVDFKIQPLLPHMHSRGGPGIAVGDVNGDGLEDFFIGAARGSNGSFFIQNKNGSFIPQALKKDTLYEDMGTLLFDADGDGDLDLLVVSSGSESVAGSAMQQDRLYLNDGRGNFEITPASLPDTKASGSCAVACDYDKDGDLDLFIGGRVSPGSYPVPAQSYLLQNDGGRFTNVTASQLPKGGKMGMVTSALWTDYDSDGWIDLLLTGEFMPVTFLKNQNGKLTTQPLELPHSSGWWNSLAPGDFDEDGDMDYIAGNLGLNSRHKASPAQPLCVYAKDYDGNGRLDPVMCYYVGGKNYIFPTRDEMIKQMPAMRVRFQSYKDFAGVTFEESFTKDELSNADVVKAECFESSYFRNEGGGKFTRISLPLQAQFAPLFGMLVNDYNADGHLDVLLTGNSYATEVSTGNYDAFSGLLLLGTGKGNFIPRSTAQTGFTANNDSKGIAEITLVDGAKAILVGVNNGPMEAYKFSSVGQASIPVKNNEVYAIIHKKDGTAFRQELYWGNTYLSQSSRKITYDKAITPSIEVYNSKGSKRKILVR